MKISEVQGLRANGNAYPSGQSYLNNWDAFSLSLLQEGEGENING